MTKCYCEYYWPCQHCLTVNPNYKQDIYDEMMKEKDRGIIIYGDDFDFNAITPFPLEEAVKKELDDYINEMDRARYSMIIGPLIKK